MKRKLSLVLALVLLLTAALLGCKATNTETTRTEPQKTEQQTQETLEKVELRVLWMNEAPLHWDEILAEVNNRISKAINATLKVNYVPAADYPDKSRVQLLSGETFEVFYDAPWMHMDALIAQNAIRPIDDLIEKYPNVKKAFDPVILDANRYNGKVYGLPLFPYFGGGNGFVYRKDLADKYNITIKSFEDVEKFLRTIAENEKGMIPFTAKPADLLPKFRRYTADYKALMKDGPVKNLLNVYHDKTTDTFTVKIIYEDPISVKYNKMFNDWYKEGLLDKDIISRKSNVPREMIETGKAASSIEGALNIEDRETRTRLNIPEAKLGFEWLFEPGFRQIGDYTQWNTACFNAKGENPDRMMAFYDWVYSDQENYDLLALGIKGKHYIEVDDKYFDYPPTLPPTERIVFNNGMLVRNYAFDKTWVGLSDLSKKQWEEHRDFKAFEPSPLNGFNFDATPVKKRTGSAGSNSSYDNRPD